MLTGSYSTIALYWKSCKASWASAYTVVGMHYLCNVEMLRKAEALYFLAGYCMEASLLSPGAV